MNLALRIAHVWGTDVRAHWTWVLLLAIITVFFGTSLAAQGSPGLDPVWAWGSAIATAALVFLSVTVHELAHAGMARRDGIGGPVVVVQLLGGSYVMELRPRTAGQEFRAAVVGPVVSLVVAVVFGIVGGWLELSWGAAASVPDGIFSVAFVSEMLALFNGFLAVVNMLPGYPMDGARVVHAIAWARSGREDLATATASRVGRLAGGAIMLAGMAVIALVDLWPGVALLAAGWLVIGSSRILDRRAFLEGLIAGARVGDAADLDPQRVPAQLTLEFYAPQFVAERAGDAAVVERAGEPVGLIGTSQIRRIPARKWEEVRSEDAMVALDRVPRIGADEALWPALETLERSGLDALVVEPASGEGAAEAPGRRLGLLTRRSAAELIHGRAEDRARQLALTKAAATFARPAASLNEGSPDGPPPDGPSPDGPSPDGPSPDGQSPDGQSPDGQPSGAPARPKPPTRRRSRPPEPPAGQPERSEEPDE